MSYIVKSRDFPKSCNECDEPHLCCDFYYCGVGHQKDGRHLDVDEHYLNNTKHPDCPLVKIPTPHGRLIDDFKLLRALINAFPNQSMNFYDTLERVIDEAPTIIEAEVSE